MTLLLSDADVRASIDMARLTEALDEGFREEGAARAAVAPRLNTEIDGTWMRLMPAIIPSMGVMGFKAFHGNRSYGARFLVILSSMNSGEVLACVDGNYLTAARTAATSAVATKHMARARGTRLAVIGSGMEAETHVLAMTAMGNIEDVRVFSPNVERREAFAAQMTRRLDRVPVAACTDALSAVKGSDHVVIATNTGAARTVAYRADWIEPGQHLSAIGSTNPRLRELETDVFRRVDAVAFDASGEQLMEESGDVIALSAEGGSVAGALWLPDIVNGAAIARKSDDDVTLFKSVGSGLQDVIAAAQIYEAAVAQGRGTTVPDLCELKILPPPTK